MQVDFPKDSVACSAAPASRDGHVSAKARLRRLAADLEEDKLTLCLFYLLPFVAVDPLCLIFGLSSVAITACLFERPVASEAPPPRIGLALLTFLFFLGFLLGIASDALPFPWGGFVTYQCTLGGNARGIPVFPGLAWLSPLLVSLFWLLFIVPPRGPGRFGAFHGFKRKIGLTALLVLPILLRRFLFGVEDAAQFADTPSHVLLLLAAAALYQTAVIEEFFFRGFLFRVFLSRMTPFAAAALASLSFALTHFGLESLRLPVQWADILLFLRVFVTGLSLCFIYHRTRSLFVVILYHASLNGTQWLVIWLYRGGGLF